MRLLKWLVIVLTLSLIGGVITVIWLLVTRLPLPGSPRPTLPEALALPAGEKAEALTMGRGWLAVVTESGRLLVFGADGRLRQELRLDLPAAPADPAP